MNLYGILCNLPSNCVDQIDQTWSQTWFRPKRLSFLSRGEGQTLPLYFAKDDLTDFLSVTFSNANAYPKKRYKPSTFDLQKWGFVHRIFPYFLSYIDYKIMGRTINHETMALLSHQVPLKFPLGLVSEHVRPYLELIRLEKVGNGHHSSRSRRLQSHFKSLLEWFWYFGLSVTFTVYGASNLSWQSCFTAWGLTMAAYRSSLPTDTYFLDLLKCCSAAFIVRSSACTVNDIFDRKLDAGVGESDCKRSRCVWQSTIHDRTNEK